MFRQKPLFVSTYEAQTFVQLYTQIWLIIAPVVGCPHGKLSPCLKNRPHDILSCQRIFCHIELYQKNSTMYDFVKKYFATTDGYVREYINDMWKICFKIFFFTCIHLLTFMLTCSWNNIPALIMYSLNVSPFAFTTTLNTFTWASEFTSFL